MMLSSSVLRGMQKERAELYGKPHLGAVYVGGSGRYRATSVLCCICGARASNVHHVARRSWGKEFELVTPNGTWRLRSPLFALCGSGTTGCHGRFHGAGLKAEWVWDDPEGEEAWWSGELLRECAPHDERLYDYGHWEITDPGGSTTERRG